MSKNKNTTTEAATFYKNAGDKMAYLAGRWSDEKQYEDINDYQKPLNPIAEKAGVVIEKMLKQPFGCIFRAPNGKAFKATMKMSGEYAYQEQPKMFKAPATKPQAPAKASKAKAAKPKAEKKSKPAQPKSEDKGPSRTAYIDSLILKGGLTARQIAEKALGNFPDSTLEQNLTIARSRPWHLKQKGLTPKTKIAERGTGKVALMKSMLAEGKHTCQAIAEAVVKQFGGDVNKTKVVVRSMPWHMKKQGLKGSYRKANATPAKVTKKVTKKTAAK